MITTSSGMSSLPFSAQFAKAVFDFRMTGNAVVSRSAHQTRPRFAEFALPKYPPDKFRVDGHQYNQSRNFDLIDEAIASTLPLLDVTVPYTRFEHHILRPGYAIANELTRLKFFNDRLDI